MLSHSGAQRNFQLAPLGVSHAVDVFVTSLCATLRVYSAVLTPLRPCRLLSWVRSTWSAFSSSAAPLAPKPVVRGRGALTATLGPLGQFGTQGTGNLTITKWTGCSRIYRCPPGNPKGHARNRVSQPNSGMPANFVFECLCSICIVIGLTAPAAYGPPYKRSQPIKRIPRLTHKLACS